MTPSASTTAGPTQTLITALRHPECYPHAVAGIRVIETHISWVLLTGEYAYKIKKPIDVGFANFSSLSLRHHFCQEELRLNGRFAPELYLEVVPICGDTVAPRMGGTGPVIDYAVKMREFPQDALASRALAAGKFGVAEIDRLAELIAGFHGGAARAPAGGLLGSPEAVLSWSLQNFDQMSPLITTPSENSAFRLLREWSEREHATRRQTIAARLADGFIRDCHGDLHLGNIALIDTRPLPFDCIEFNDELRWIDVMSEVAFLVMDLEDRGHGDYGWRFLNRYLEVTGDYGGIGVLRFYLAYRALVRAKVHLMRSLAATRDSERVRLARAFRSYLRLAQRYVAPPGAALVLTHGLSGCGKTTATQSLLEQIAGIRIRSDLERKRAHGVAPLSASGSGLGSGIYTADANAATYRRLGALAQTILSAGFSVIVDATFLKRVDREAFRTIAEQCAVPLLILDFHAPLELLRARVRTRRARADDASEADVSVLERQIAIREPLTPAEMADAVIVDSTRASTGETWHSVRQRIPRNITD